MAASAEPPAPEHPFLDVSWLARIARFTEECEQAYAIRSRHPGPAVTVFGSARSKPGDVSYEAAVLTGRALAEGGVLVITGGGPGAMEAANRGAFQVNPELSIGCNIQLPHEQSGNPFAAQLITFSDFAPRKVSMIDLAQGFVICKGGFGTRDEFYELLTKIQTGRIPRRPIVLLESERGIWEDLVRDARRLADTGMISDEDLALIQITDDPEVAAELASAPARAELAAWQAGDPDPSRTRTRSVAEVVPAWSQIHGLLRQHGHDAAFLDPVGQEGGGRPVVVVPAASLRAPAGRRTLGDELTRRLEEEGYEMTPVPVEARGLSAREYVRREGDAVTVASVDWRGGSLPDNDHVVGIDGAVARSRQALGPGNHVLGDEHRLAVKLALGREPRDQLLEQPWVSPAAVAGAITLLSRNPSRRTMGLASWLMNGEYETRGEISAESPAIAHQRGLSFEPEIP